MNGGVPAAKLVLGLGTYGRSFTLASSTSTTAGIGAPARGAGNRQPYTQEAGFASYYEILAMGGTKTYDAATQTMIAVSGDQWIGYDNQQTLTYKVDYALSKQLAGVMIWSLDLDDFPNNYPLITTISQRVFAPYSSLQITMTSASFQFDEDTVRNSLSAEYGVDPSAIRIVDMVVGGASVTPNESGTGTVETTTAVATIQVVETFDAPLTAAEIVHSVACSHGNQNFTFSTTEACGNAMNLNSMNTVTGQASNIVVSLHGLVISMLAVLTINVYLFA